MKKIAFVLLLIFAPAASAAQSEKPDCRDAHEMADQASILLSNMETFSNPLVSPSMLKVREMLIADAERMDKHLSLCILANPPAGSRDRFPEETVKYFSATVASLRGGIDTVKFNWATHRFAANEVDGLFPECRGFARVYDLAVQKDASLEDIVDAGAAFRSGDCINKLSDAGLIYAALTVSNAVSITSSASAVLALKEENALIKDYNSLVERHNSLVHVVEGLRGFSPTQPPPMPIWQRFLQGAAQGLANYRPAKHLECTTSGDIDLNTVSPSFSLGTINSRTHCEER